MKGLWAYVMSQQIWQSLFWVPPIFVPLPSLSGAFTLIVESREHPHAFKCIDKCTDNSRVNVQGPSQGHLLRKQLLFNKNQHVFLS